MQSMTNKEILKQMGHKPRCADCVWYEPEPGGTAGRCLVDPPVAHLAVAQTAIGQPKPIIQGIRPPVGPNERCSRHAPIRSIPVNQISEIAFKGG
jgi:hypothetical protein